MLSDLQRFLSILLMLFCGSCYCGQTSLLSYPYNFTSPDTTPWILPGPPEVGLQTEHNCYNFYDGKVEKVPSVFNNFQPIQTLSPFNDYSNYWYGYQSMDNEHIWYADFQQGCAAPVQTTIALDLNSIPQFNLSERVITLVKDTNGTFNYLISTEAIYQLTPHKTFRTLFPPSGNYSIITGVFYVGIYDSYLDYLYIGRAQNNLTDHGEVLVYLSNDQLSFIQFDKTIQMISAPLNFQATQGYANQNDCQFLFFHLFQQSAYYASNICTGSFSSVNLIEYNYDPLAKMKVYSSASQGLLIVAIEIDTGFELFIFIPSDTVLTLQSNDKFPDQVLTPTQDECGGFECIMVLTHDASNGDAKIVFYDLHQDFFVRSPPKQYFPHTSSPVQDDADCCSGTGCGGCDPGETCFEITNPHGPLYLNYTCTVYSFL